MSCSVYVCRGKCPKLHKLIKDSRDRCVRCAHFILIMAVIIASKCLCTSLTKLIKRFQGYKNNSQIIKAILMAALLVGLPRAFREWLHKPIIFNLSASSCFGSTPWIIWPLLTSLLPVYTHSPGELHTPYLVDISHLLFWALFILLAHVFSLFYFSSLYFNYRCCNTCKLCIVDCLCRVYFLVLIMLLGL